MLNAKRWLAMLLAVSLLFNLIPMNVLAEESADISAESAQSESPAAQNLASSPEGDDETEPSDPTETSEPSESSEPSEPTETSEPSEPTETSEPSEPTETTGVEDPTAANAPEGEEESDEMPVVLSFADAFANSFAGILAAENYTPAQIITTDGNSITLHVSDGKILALLSQQTQAEGSNYQNWTISLEVTGGISLDDTFQGLGSVDFPFQGTFSGSSPWIKTKHTLFKHLSSEATLAAISIKWAGSQSEAIFAENLILKNDYTIPMPLSFEEKNNNNKDDARAFSPFLGTVAGAFTAILPTLDYTNADPQSVVPTDADLGLLCRQIGGGASLQVSNLILPDGIQFQFNTSENTGGLVGSMDASSTLIISQAMALNLLLIGNNAGGLVGKMEAGATINFQNGGGVDVTAALKATNAGGIAGEVTTQTGPITPYSAPSGQANDAPLNNVRIRSVKANGSKNAGILYGKCTVNSSFDPFSGVTFTDNAMREVSGAKNCGGVFGTLTIEGTGTCSISADTESTLTFNNGITGASNTGNTTQYGGIAGTLSNGARKNPLVVDSCSITSTVSVGTDTNNYPKYIGGIVAVQGANTTVDAKNSTVKVCSPKTITAADRGFGGVTAYLDDNALLIVEDMKIITDSYATNPGGGGVVGSAHKGSIVYLKTSLDLSECQLSTNATSGQIVGSQDCSLIYAPGVAITRLDATVDGKLVQGMELDDIGNYGELYRIQGFMTVSEDGNYTVNFPNTLIQDSGAYILNSKLDYACLALAWQARGYFSTVAEVTKDNWSTSSIKSSTITLGADINLKDCGIGGLTRDVYSADDTFTGTFNGGDKTLTLDIGATNVANTVTTGDGRIYWHNATGLFAALGTGANVSGLKLAGSIRLSNNKITPMRSGALAAYASGIVTIRDVSTQVTFHAICNGANVLYLGGLVGLISGTDSTALTLGNGAKLAATFSLSHSGNGAYNHIGGAIGGIDGKAGITLTCNGTTLSGNITSTGSINNLYAGGLVGTIVPANNSIRTITLTNLTVSDFTLSGTASERMGGILGGIWANTDVTVNGLTVSSATLTASGAAALGGLVYRASGKWTVSSVDLSGLNITANSASALGILVCQGGPYKDTINGSYQNVDGLYLEMTEHWDWDANAKKGYNVPSSINFGNGVFDEFVAYTAWADRNNGTPNYQITTNGSGVISLTTANGTVNMTDGARNTYVNRTTIGQSKQTNPYSRYYYNLPTVKTACDGGNIDTANELLIWSVYRYAASNLKTHFQIDNVTSGTIGGTGASSRASFDMKGLSYYPINITNANVTVQYADVKFYNSDIEKKETTPPENKSTRGDSTNHTQHYTMHCALFLNFTADLKNATEYSNRTMKVNGVTFSGTVGVVNGGSGALVCGRVAGETREGNTSICTVVLADGDEENKAVSLNGLSVAPEGDYTPALLNTIGSYAGLKANYVTTTQATKAGSSLIGDVGGQGATGVSIAFAGNIKLPETGVFSKATLLNSLRYNSGSATYNFYKSKDYTGDTYVHNATHGKELSKTVEYAGKQGCYYDGYGKGYYVSKDSSFDAQNNFSSYLPYVAFSPATRDTTHTLKNGWHEIAVNVLSDDVKDGCGTYGHPYKVNGNLLKQVADYINTGTASDGWQVRISTDNAYHTTELEHDVLLTYTSDGWKNGETPCTDKDVRQYLQSAYYVITEDIELSDFYGIGNVKDWAFSGVIKGQQQNNGEWPTVTLSGGSTAFIQYSYGSVVRDLNIVLNQSPTLERETWARGTAEQAPGTFFGGVIGCVLGGDNIIDNVTVTTGAQHKITLSGTNPHLIPVGGYVGVIAGGGVIFRGTISSNTGITGTDAPLYRNPIIGRVLGGYAFYEGDGDAPNNTDKNYTINTLSDGNHLSWDGSTLIVNNAQGLLILSAIVSSGAGSKQSNAYDKGTKRNAHYNHIGEAETEGDYPLTQSNTVPYLLSKYAGCTQWNSICLSGEDGIDVKFAENATFDMTGYDNGYRGLSARYVSNAAFTSSGVDASAVVMRVKTFNGQNADVQNINMDVKEYNDDDFHMASMGGIFNIVWTQKQSGGGGVGSNFAQNLTLTNCNVSLKYVNSSGTEQNEAHSDTFARKDGMRAVSVGGFIGMANDIDASSTSQKTLKHNYLFSNIHIRENSAIVGPNSAGSLIGATAMASTSVEGYPGKLLANGKWALFGPSFLNCSYSNITVTGGLAAGGLIGDAYTNGSSTIPNFYGLGMQYLSNGAVYLASYTSCTVTEENFIVGKNATIKTIAQGSIAGGLFGGAGMRVGVNDPDVDTKSGITIASKNPILPLSLQDVSISVSTTDYDPGSVDRPDNSINYAYAAGIIGRIGNVNPSCFYDIHINGGGVTSREATASRVGGIQGSGYTNSAITMERCEISSYNLSGANTGGFLGNGQSYDLFKFYMTDCKLTDSSVSGTSTAGGLVGDAQSFYYLYNILIKNTSITKNGKIDGAGRLFGNVVADKGYIYASGISVYCDPNHDPVLSVPGTDIGSGSITAGYIAYADYAGTETAVTDQNSPYVTVNPNFPLPGVNKTLYGDAVGKILEDDTYNSVAARIWADQKAGAAGKKNLVSYQNVTSIADGNSVPEVLSFQSFQKYGDSESVYTNFPVLVIKGGDASPILNYLNVITNNGYKIAMEKAESYVTVEDPKVYYYNKETNQFRVSTGADAPASIIKNASNTFEVKTGSYDNTRDRFTLLEFKFKTTVNGTNKYYTVSIPVVVERELQYDFMATFTPGTVFQEDFYSNLKDHILESSGTPITAYLTYRYNRNKNTYVEYDWQSYLTEDGFDMLIGSQAMDKTLVFNGGLPKDTQLILIDRQNGNQAYQYEVAADSGIETVKLSEFTSVCNDKVHFRPSLGVVLGIVAAEDSANGKFVRTTDPTNAILLRDGNSYRLAKDTDTDTRYTLTVPNLEENTAEENYYLVVTVPATDDPTYKLNGDLSSTLIWVPNSGTQVHRYDPTLKDDRSQTESTYQISSGYQQSLTAHPEEVTTKDVASVSTPLTIYLLDTISFDKAQLYTENDKLYLKFSASLMSCLVDNDQQITSKLVQFPVGTTGTVHFYVQDEIGNYYFLNGTVWEQRSTKPAPISYHWESNGANIELPLSTDGRTALDLSGVRTAVKGQASEGIGKILVTAQMDVYFGSENILEDTIPASANGTDAYAQLHYVSRISTLENSLDTSTVRATEDDKVKYYRAVQTNTSLSMDASNIDQLGVNPLQLVAEYQQTLNGKNASRIDLAVTLDLITPEKAQAFLKNTKTLHFSLNLYRRHGEQNGEKYFEPIFPNADALLAVKWSEAGAEGPFGWSYDIPRESFIGDDVDPMLFNGTMFTIPLTAYVYTAPTDFANYKLEVSVSFLDAFANEVENLPIMDDKDAYVVYTYACIKPSFYEPTP